MERAAVETSSGFELRRVLRRIRLTIKYGSGHLLNWFGFPGFIKPMSFYDGVLGCQITIRNSHVYTKLTIGNRDFYFYRSTGGYDGSGASIVSKKGDFQSGQEASPNRCRADSVPR